MSQFSLKSDIMEIVENLQGEFSLLEGKTILMTGERGFLGRYFTQALLLLNKEVLKKPCKVIGLDCFITSGELGRESLKDPNYEFHEHDIIQPLKPNAEKIDYILHMAGIASPYYYRAYPLQTMDVAITGTRNVLDLAKEHDSKILFFSSSEIYGDPDPKFVPTQESYRGNVSCLGPRACYDESKRLGETLCRIYHTQFGTRVNMVRPFNVYGPGMQQQDYRVLPNFGNQIVKNLPLKVYGKGDQTRTFCYITDAVTGFLKTLLHGIPGEPYNIGNPRPEISMLDLSKEIEAVTEREIKVDLVDYPDSYPADEPNRRCPDITKAQRQLNYEPRVELRDGLGRFFNWALENYV